MGYLLPIRPIQSEQYANRMTMEPYNFATVTGLYRVRLESDFLNAFEETLDSSAEKEINKVEEQSVIVPSPLLARGFIPPNPANLSPAISRVVGKGMSVNRYI